MIPGDLLSAFPHRQFHTLPGLLDSWAALPNSNPNACVPMQGGSLHHFYDGGSRPSQGTANGVPSLNDLTVDGTLNTTNQRTNLTNPVSASVVHHLLIADSDYMHPPYSLNHPGAITGEIAVIST